MRATQTKLLDFIIKQQHQFVIPVYQRMYSWEYSHCEKLWSDIIKAGSSDDIKAHFIGSIMYMQNDIYSASDITQLSVIDGQQRITTITLILIAMRDFFSENDEFSGITKAKIGEIYLINPHEIGEKQYKLILSQNDKDTLIYLIDSNKPKPDVLSKQIMDNLKFFKEKLYENKYKLDKLCAGIKKLIIVDITLERGSDNPQLIFESMNSTGKNLYQADLIRNYILMELEPKIQTQLYEKYWREIEKDFGQGEIYNTYFNRFIRDYLTIKTDSIPSENKVYEAFKKYMQDISNQNVSRQNIESVLKDLKKYSQYFSNIVLDKEPDSKLRTAFKDLKELNVKVSYPFLMQVYDDYENKIINESEFLSIIRLIESYIARRFICNVSSNGLNNIFQTLLKNVDKKNYVESLKAKFIMQKSLRFPKDSQFIESFIEKEIYLASDKRKYFIRKLENFNNKEIVDIENLTIEHIMPQNLNDIWITHLGDNHQEIHEKYLHTIGNLTLSGYNASYKDKSFVEKRDMEHGFKDSPLRLNKFLKKLDKWGKDEILQRAKALANDAIKIWAMPSINETTIQNYMRNKENKTLTYTIKEYHPNLLQGKNNEIFEILKERIIGLDSNIYMEILKKYIAFKINDKNIVCIVPQKNNLKITLNINKEDLNDSKMITEDISGKGAWGTGNTQFKLEFKDEITYAMQLILQSYENYYK